MYRLYDTKNNADGAIVNTFDCLYHLYHEALNTIYKPDENFGNVISIRFCRRIVTKHDNATLSSDAQIVHGEKFSFTQLRKINVSAQELFNWYAPIDTIESYIDENSEGVFFNCSRDNKNVWFGPQCQYTFDYKYYFLEPIPGPYLLKRFDYFPSASSTNGTCYPIMEGECQSIICLDWREICDGKIDCNNGFDEHHCHKLEINECDNMTEYRCVNGQCIDKAFYLDKEYDCMDESDEGDTGAINNHHPFSLVDQDRLCPLMWFSCGDGQCYDGPHFDLEETSIRTGQCRTNRDRLYSQQMQKSKFILFTHVTLIYDDTVPQYICYNETLCPYLSMNEFNDSQSQIVNGLVCRAFNVFNGKNFKYVVDMFKEFKRFIRSCSLPPKIKLLNECSMFSCNDNSKCLSFHRLSDGFQDCLNGEDEQQNQLCSHDLSYYRFKCDHGKNCIRKTLVADKIGHCSDMSDEYGLTKTARKGYKFCHHLESDICREFRGQSHSQNITFSKICNGIVEYIPDNENNTDESDCSTDEWSCLTYYTKCNGIWNCPNGRDELGCRPSIPQVDFCINSSLVCFDITTGLPICLSQVKIGDGHIDCVGSIDERTFCRMKYPNSRMNRYRCRNTDVCIRPAQICDCHQDCPENDDETLACIWVNNGKKPFCNKKVFRCRDGRHVDCEGGQCRCDGNIKDCSEGEDELFCDLIDIIDNRSFRPVDLEEYPNLTQHRVERRSSISESLAVWYCNQGLYIRSADNSSDFHCLCSDHYYGDRCQYQRRRISLILQLFIKDSFDRRSSFKIAALLVRQNTTIVSHDQYLYAPQFQCSTKHYLELLYPINESWPSSSPFKYSIHIYSFMTETLEKRGSWQFDIPFSFLPVNRIAKRLFIAETAVATSSSSWTKIYEGNCSSCSTKSICIGHDIDMSRDICICSSNYTGSRCLMPLYSCTDNACNGHGQCIEHDIRFYPQTQFRCLCDDGWYGDFCDKSSAVLTVSFAKEITIPSFKIALIHVIKSDYDLLHLLFFYRLSHERRNYTIFLNGISVFDGLVFIQLYESLNEFNFYLLIAHENTYDNIWQNVSSQIHPSRRCRSITELFNATVTAQPELRRIKYYQQLCLKRTSDKSLLCFYDDELMCICEKTNYANCFNLNSRSFACTWNTCSNRGKCIQPSEKCPISSFCICEPCSYGSICQFTTSGYALSLDAILGSHIHTITANIHHQTTIIKTSVILISIVVIVGVLLNILAIGTFVQKKAHQVGSGLYLLISSLIGLLTSIMLMCKIMLLIGVEQNNITCSLFEFLLKWGPACSEWLNACVAIERILAVMLEFRYSNQASKRRTKWVIASILLCIGACCSPELIFRRTVVDRQDQRIWCVFTLNKEQKFLHKFHFALTILLFMIPCAINLISSIIIIVGTIRSKEKSGTLEIPKVATIIKNKNNRFAIFINRWKPIKEQIMKHKHIIIAPIVLAILSTPRIVFSFTFVCTKLDRNVVFPLVIYLIGFLPSMAILIAFVFPSDIYRQFCITFIKQTIPKSIQTWFADHFHR